MRDDKPRFDARVGRWRRVLLILVALLAAAAVGCAMGVDARVHAYLEAHPNDWHANYWLEGFRQLGKAWAPVWLLLIWAWASGRPRPATVALIALVLVMLVVLPVKQVVRRPRPHHVTVAGAPTGPPPGHSYSFPSGDTASAFAVAGALTACLPVAGGVLLLVGAGGIGLLRVTMQAHFPSDVCAGAAVGLLCAWVVLEFSRRRLTMDWWRAHPWWRPAVGLAAAALLPIAQMSERINPMGIFLGTYGFAVAVWGGIGAWQCLRAQRHDGQSSAGRNLRKK